MSLDDENYRATLYRKITSDAIDKIRHALAQAETDGYTVNPDVWRALAALTTLTRPKAPRTRRPSDDPTAST